MVERTVQNKVNWFVADPDKKKVFILCREICRKDENTTSLLLALLIRI